MNNNRIVVGRYFRLAFAKCPAYAIAISFIAADVRSSRMLVQGCEMADGFSSEPILCNTP
jgi:hypothetical protein